MGLGVFVTGAISLLAVIWRLVLQFRQVQAEPSPQLLLSQVRCSDPAACIQILACKGYENTGARNLYSSIRSRAIPNQRLVRAFGIDNSFTTSNDERRRAFNKEARDKIKISEAKVGTPSDRNLFFFLQASRRILRATRHLIDNAFWAKDLETPWTSDLSARSNADINIM